MRIAVIVLAVVAIGIGVLVALIAALGARLPADHVVTRSIVVARAPRDVVAVLRDFGAAAAWRTGIERVDLVDARHFREVGKRGTVTYEIVDDSPDAIVTRIADTNLGYTGSWTYRVAPEAAGTRVSITETGSVTNVFFRFVARHFFSPTATLDAYLADLEKRLA